VEASFSNVRFVHAADVDDDGDLDIVGASEGNDEIAWWENFDGDGTIWTEHVVDEDFDGANSIEAGDIDGDGDLDLLGTASIGDEVTWWENTDGQGTNWIEHLVDDTINSPRSAQAVDLDGDGDLDVVGAVSTDDDIIWWENLDGLGTSWTRYTVESSFLGAWAIRAVDIDGDGFIDLLAAALSADRVTWWRNVNGDGSIWTAHEVDGSVNGASSVDTADFDGDGDLDVVGAAKDGDEIVWWENGDGSGISWAKHTVDDSFDEPYSLRAADIDWDGDFDILAAANNDNEIVWWENEDGLGTTWTEHPVVDLFNGAITVDIADLDGDGDLDVVGGAWNSGEISWWRNVDADANCAPGAYEAGRPVRVTAAPAPGWGVGGWSGTTDDASTSLDNRVLMPQADHEATVHYLEGCFSLLLTHTGMGEDPVATPLNSDGCPAGRYVVGTEIELAASPDLGWQVGGWLGTDRDNDTGLTNTVTMPAADHEASVDYIAPCFSLFLSHSGEGSDPAAEPPSSEGCPLDTYRSSELVTLTAAPDPSWQVGAWLGTDDDASLELINSVTMPAEDHEVSVDYIQCFELAATHTGNGLDPLLAPWGNGSVWTEHPVATEFNGAASAHAADVDGDGDVDLLGAGLFEDAISWWENIDGQGTLWSEHLVEGDLNEAQSVYAADVDGDGDIDVLGAIGGPDEIAWWENVGGDGTIWTKHLVVTGFFGADAVRAADVDSDGDIDILGAASSVSDITWWENTDGTGTIWIQRLVDGSFGGAKSVEVADIDGDGDLDILGAAQSADEISWWENLNGAGTAWTKNVVANLFDSTFSAYPADVDGDGDIDVLGASFGDDEVAWWENDGTGTTWIEHLVGDDFLDARSVYAADLDGDGDIDVLGAAEGADDITWWENLDGIGLGWAEHPIAQEFDTVRFVSAADIDGDGDPDVLGAARNGDEISWWENVFVGTSCSAGEYSPGQRIQLTADPDPGWGIDSWSGTEDDASTSSENLVIMPTADHEVAVHYLEGCAVLTLTHTGLGADPVADPASSEGCADGSYVPGERIGLTAAPDPGWVVEGWLGTDDDDSDNLVNEVTMPASDHLVAVDYSAVCFSLTLRHLGEGANPTADPLASTGCSTGEYIANEVITLTAGPAPAWEVTGWRGTDDDTSREITNTITMPATTHEAAVRYNWQCFTLARSHTGMGTDPMVSPWGDGTSWSENRIEGSLDGARSVDTIDVDGDGDLDVLATGLTADGVAWWENLDGRGASWERHLVERGVDGARSVRGADIDGDGDTDILAAAELADEVLWWENLDGVGRSWAAHLIDAAFDGALSIQAEDIDGDGILDVVGAADQGNEIVWWRNVDGTGTSWIEHPVAGSFRGARAVDAADVDGDGDVDILGAADIDDEITWWENRDGAGLVWTERLVDGAFDGAWSVASADVDGDGDRDILGAAFNADEISWWENLDGDGRSWIVHAVDLSFSGASSVQAVDLDGDGDPDILGAADFANDIAWWENEQGDGTVWVEHGIDRDFTGARAATAADVDGDGDSDVVGAAFADDQIAWWRNRFVSVGCAAGEHRAGQQITVAATPDPGWTIGGWSGTEDDTSTSTRNLVLMPLADHEVGVEYIDADPDPAQSTGN